MGYMVIGSVTGAFQDNESIQVGGVTKMTANGADEAIELQPGGKFELISHNFFGLDATYNLYGCDGVNPAFEYDGTVFTPILLRPDLPDVPEFNKPKFIAAHSSHLFLAFDNGSLQHSEPGLPLNWSGFLGAAEFGLGSDITGLQVEAGGVLSVFTRRKTYGLYGTDVTNWDLKIISEKSGAFAYSVQNIGTSYALDDRGITRMDRAQVFGDFESATVSRKVEPFLRRDKELLIGSIGIRGKNQYRLFFSNGFGLIMTYDGQLGTDGLASFTTFDMTVIPFCLNNSEDENGNEVPLIGAEDGFVYEMEKGDSWDGEPIEHALRLPYNHQQQPRTRKSYKWLGMDIQGTKTVDLKISTELSYGDTSIQTSKVNDVRAFDDIEIFGGGGYWGVDSWDEFYWDAQQVASDLVSITGTGTNISVLIYGKSATMKRFTIEAIYLHYLIRRMQRG
jgi:hypothetical protein